MAETKNNEQLLPEQKTELSEEAKREIEKGQKELEALGGPVNSQKKISGVSDEVSSAVLADLADGKPTKKATAKTATAFQDPKSVSTPPAKKAAASKQAAQEKGVDDEKGVDGARSEASTSNTQDGVKDSSSEGNAEQTENNAKAKDNG